MLPSVITAVPEACPGNGEMPRRKWPGGPRRELGQRHDLERGPQDKRVPTSQVRRKEGNYVDKALGGGRRGCRWLVGDSCELVSQETGEEVGEFLKNLKATREAPSTRPSEAFE